MPPKLCKDCRHGKRDWLFGWEFAKCRAPQTAEMNLVDGHAEPRYCENQRKFDLPSTCGAAGKFYEPKGLHNAH